MPVSYLLWGLGGGDARPHATKHWANYEWAWSRAINMNINELPVQSRFASAAPGPRIISTFHGQLQECCRRC